MLLEELEFGAERAVHEDVARARRQLESAVTQLERLEHRRRMRRHGRRAYIRSVYFLPSLATLGNAICGFGAIYVAGLSNEEFASKLRTIAYPFSAVEPGTSVEIYHGNHGALETRSPVYAFVPYNVGGTPHLIAGYLCTPLVKFPMASLSGTRKVVM